MGEAFPGNKMIGSVTLDGETHRGLTPCIDAFSEPVLTSNQTLVWYALRTCVFREVPLGHGTPFQH